MVLRAHPDRNSLPNEKWDDSLRRLRLFEAEEVEVAAGIAGDDGMRIRKCATVGCAVAGECGYDGA